jgi:hypothetical protein
MSATPMSAPSQGLSHVSDDSVLTAVGVRNVPEAIRSLGALANPDYVDLYTVTTSEATNKSPEDWARAALEETPTGRSAPSLWRLLGLRLGPRQSPDYVQGWKIADRSRRGASRLPRNGAAAPSHSRAGKRTTREPLLRSKRTLGESAALRAPRTDAQRRNENFTGPGVSGPLWTRKAGDPGPRLGLPPSLFLRGSRWRFPREGASIMSLPPHVIHDARHGPRVTSDTPAPRPRRA